MAHPHFTPDHHVATPVVRLEGRASRPPAGRWLRTGTVLMLLSVLFWVPLPAIPFLPISVEARAALTGAALVLAEITFWLGALLAGPEAVKRMKGWVRDKLRMRKARASE